MFVLVLLAFLSFVVTLSPSFVQSPSSHHFMDRYKYNWTDGGRVRNEGAKQVFKNHRFCQLSYCRSENTSQLVCIY